jgi:glycerol-3-phosphate dehydrogenase (NAD(P)+)
MKRITIIGDGAWGTALALLLHSKGCTVKIWGNFPDYIEEQRQKRENYKFLPGIDVPQAIGYTADLDEAAKEADLLVSAVPTQFIRSVFEKLAPYYPKGVPVVSVSKGIEQKTLKRCTEVVAEFLEDAPLAALSGPSHAEEVARNVPTAVVVASKLPSLRGCVMGSATVTTQRAHCSPEGLSKYRGWALPLELNASRSRASQALAT